METLQKFEGDLNALVASSINVNPQKDSDCVDFDATFIGIGFSGKFCTRSLKLTVTIKVFGISISTQEFDLKDGNFCNTISLGIEWINFCFGIKDGCLITSGYIEGVFHGKETWNAKIICF